LSVYLFIAQNGGVWFLFKNNLYKFFRYLLLITIIQ
jgi:hypothetical protein